jgi:DNA-directed RNA polymerase subunit M/transcription elongation factor TFIIS
MRRSKKIKSTLLIVRFWFGFAATLKRTRRAHIVRCCGGGCDGPAASSALEMRPGGKRANGTNRAARRKVNYEVLAYNPLNNKLFIKRKNKPATRQDGGGSNKAVAKLVRGGISITCPRCPADWQNQLRLGNRVGTIPVVCPGCAPNWREYLPQDFKMTTVKGGASKHMLNF